MKSDKLIIYIVTVIVIGFVIFFYYIGREFNSGSNNGLSSFQRHAPLDEYDADIVEDRYFSQYPRRQHPVLSYQRVASYDTHPANYGDPIRPPPEGVSSGPTSHKSSFKRAYGPGYEGPIVGLPLNVPIPQGSLKLSDEAYGYPFYYQRKPLSPYDYFKPYGPNQSVMQSDIVVADTPFYKRNSFGFGGPTVTSGTVPFIASVSSYAPFPEVQSDWEKTGILQTVDHQDDTIMNLYRRPIAPLQDLFEYSAQDKNGFIIPLKGVNYLEDGDIIPLVPGKEALGSWKVSIYVNNKWVWV